MEHAFTCRFVASAIVFRTCSCRQPQAIGGSLPSSEQLHALASAAHALHARLQARVIAQWLHYTAAGNLFIYVTAASCLPKARLLTPYCLPWHLPFLKTVPHSALQQLHSIAINGFFCHVLNIVFETVFHTEGSLLAWA